MSDKSDIGVIGLAVMGQNIARNFARNFQVSVYNRTTQTMQDFVDAFPEESLVGQETLEGFVNSLKTPRRILIMVKAGPAIDAVIDSLIPLLEKDDIVIDGGNALYHNTIAREKKLNQAGLHFVGMGVSGGEKGALNGPSMMIGGSEHAWEHIRPMMQLAAAKDFDGGSCAARMGSDGAGHFVKMVHNGIEYAIMQMMAEAYAFFRDGYGLSAGEIGTIFEKYQAGASKSFLFEIGTWLLKKEDDQPQISGDKNYLIDRILDTAGQKGTGRWTVTEAFEYGVAIPAISGAVEARVISADRHHFKLYEKGPSSGHHEGISDEVVKSMEDALISGVIVAYLEGLWLIEKASKERDWDIDMAEVCRIWQGGCIIQAEHLRYFQKDLKASDNDVMKLFQSENMQSYLEDLGPGTSQTMVKFAELGIPSFSLSGAYNHWKLLKSEKGSANFIQGLRDIFGAHTYQRTDREGTFHTDWYKNN
ncbi:MAG TPA: NADP-dependent phosphogluconate dehydrogenase [Candidatus Gracilibacteria bacterium]